jgi:hypothetical protein
LWFASTLRGAFLSGFFTVTNDWSLCRSWVFIQINGLSTPLLSGMSLAFEWTNERYIKLNMREQLFFCFFK